MKLRFRFCLMLAAVALAAAGTLVFFGVIPLNNPSEAEFPVRGVDVSAHQGRVDWPTLASQGIDFAFVKATEGSSFVDSRFAYNFAQAQRSGLRVGAYHFFSFESSGEAQAAHFIETVEPFPGMLPPVIDLEYYGGFFDDPPAPGPVRTELDALVERLTAHYGVSPILYVTEASYARYIEGVEAYDGLDIWIRSVYRSPQMHAWTFWQYSNRARLKGYDGDERYIDLNVFRGTEREFEEKYPNGQQVYPADSSADIDMSGRRYGGGAVCRRTGAGGFRFGLPKAARCKSPEPPANGKQHAANRFAAETTALPPSLLLKGENLSAGRMLVLKP